MGLSYTRPILLLCLLSPFNVLAQHRGYGGGPPGGFAPPEAPPPSTLTAPPPSTPTLVDAGSIDTSSVDTSFVDTGSAAASTTAGTEPVSASTQPATSAIEPITTAAGSGTGTVASASSSPSSTGGGGSCTGSGMEIQWSGDEVDFSWSGGSGTTTGCTSLGSDFAGQVAVGGSGGTIFEGNPSGYFDVSYILGYSVPMVCSSGGAKSGCSKDLLGNGGKAGTVHKNPTGPGGDHDPGQYNGCATCTPWCWACAPADPFFAPCSGSAYTYPYDDGATVGPASGAINCCIGTSCGTTGREGSTADGHPETTRDPPCDVCAGSSKRSVDELENIFKRFEAEAPAPAHSPSLLPRRRKVHKHHAVAHGAKILA